MRFMQLSTVVALILVAQIVYLDNKTAAAVPIETSWNSNILGKKIPSVGLRSVKPEAAHN